MLLLSSFWRQRAHARIRIHRYDMYEYVCMVCGENGLDDDNCLALLYFQHIHAVYIDERTRNNY